MPNRNGTGPREDSNGPRDGKGKGTRNGNGRRGNTRRSTSRIGIGKKTGGQQGDCK